MAIKNVAIIINGDNDRGDGGRHSQRNVGLAVDRFKESNHEVFVYGADQPTGIDSNHFKTATVEHIADIYKDLGGIVDGETNLTIYITGHGEKKGEEVKAVTLIDGNIAHTDLHRTLNALPHLERTLIIDNCFGGGLFKLFVEDPRTLAVSAGTENETTCCDTFTPRFLSPDN